MIEVGKTMKSNIILILVSLIFILNGCAPVKDAGVQQQPDKPGYIEEVESLLKDPNLDEDMRQILEQISYEEMPETSFEKIEKDLQAKTITEEEAVKMTLWASFGDERLPAKYKAQAPIMNISINRELLWISNNLDSMDEDSRTFFEPYILPPDDSNSFFYPGEEKSLGLLESLFLPVKVNAAVGDSISTNTVARFLPVPQGLITPPQEEWKKGKKR